MLVLKDGLLFKTSLSWLRLIGIVLFIWIASQVDWLSVWQTLRAAQPSYIIGYFIVFSMTVLLKVIRLRWFLSGFGYRLAFRDVYQIVVEAAFFGMLTPARVGEFSKVMYLVRFGFSQRKAWAVVLMERLIDFSVLIIFSIAGGLYFFVWHENIMFALVIAVLLMLFLILGLLSSGLLYKRIFPMFASLISIPFLLGSHEDNIRKICMLSFKIFLPTSIILLFFSFLQLSLLSSALGVGVSGIYLGIAYAVATLVSLLPVSINGLGTREAVYISILSYVDISENIAVTISLLDGLVFGLLFLTILFIPIVMLKSVFLKPRSINQ